MAEVSRTIFLRKGATFEMFQAGSARQIRQQTNDPRGPGSSDQTPDRISPGNGRDPTKLAARQRVLKLSGAALPQESASVSSFLQTLCPNREVACVLQAIRFYFFAEGRPLSHFVEERRRYTTYVRQYGVDGDVVQFRLRNLDQVTQPELVIARLVEQMRAQALQRHPDAILIGLNFLGGEIEAPFDVHMRHPDQNTAAALFNGLAPFFESYGTDILYSDLVEMCVTTVSPPDGASCDRAQLPDPLPRGVVPIVNPRDSFCLARAVVVGMRYHEMTTDQFTLYSGVGSDQQLQDALQLMRDA